MITFENIQIKNFFSVGNQPIYIDFQKSPTTAVTGSNGCGKSSVMLDSIFFALFGVPFRNIRKPNIVNSINQSGLECILNFSIGPKKYKIVRGIKPNVFEIYENNILLNQDAAARDYQQYLENDILGGLNQKVFKQVVVIGSADYIPFMQLRAGDRREVIEELLDITIFSRMHDVLKEKISSMKEQLRDLDYNISLTTEKVKLYKDQFVKQKEELKEKKKDLSEKLKTEQQKINDTEKLLQDVQQKLDQYNRKYAGVDILVKSIQDLEKMFNSLKQSQKQYNQQIEFFSENNVCPTCKQDINEDHKQTLVLLSEKKFKDVEASLERVLEALKKKQQNKEQYDKLQQEIQKLEKKKVLLASDIQHSKKYVGMIQTSMEDLNKPQDKTNYSQFKQEHDALTALRQQQLQEHEYMVVVQSMLKDGGIKTKIIKQYIPVFNKIINDYLIRFGLPIEFTLDDNFDEVIRSRYRDNFQYNNFSEGEKQRIDVALLLAWRQIAKSKNTVNTNLLLLDETFDSSLDTTATEELLNILCEMDKNTNIFIISHKTDLSDKLRSHIEFEKVNNFTRIKQQNGVI